MTRAMEQTAYPSILRCVSPVIAVKTFRRSYHEAIARRRRDPLGSQDLARQLRCSSSERVAAKLVLSHHFKTKSWRRDPTG